MLGFDRERVRLLGRSVRSALGDVSVVRCDDPLAADVRALLRVAHDTLEPWVDTLRDLGANRALEHHERVGAVVDDLTSLDSYLLAQGAGWIVVDDGSRPVPLDDGERAVLAAGLTTEELVTALTALQAERIEVLQSAQSDGRDPSIALDDIDRAITALVTGAVSADGTQPDALLSAVPVESAAIAFPALTGSATDLAALAVEILRRWLTRPTGAADTTAWPLDAAGDHVLAAVAASAATSQAFMHLVLADPLGCHLLTATCLDPAVATSVVLTATDPATCGVAEAGELVRPYIVHVLDAETFPDQMYDSRYRDLLGAVLAPWLLQMTSRAPDWGWDELTATDELARVLHDSEALAMLVAGSDRLVAGMATSIDLTDPAASMVALHQISRMMGWLDAFVHEEQVADELAERVLWDLGWQVVGQVTAAAVRSTGVGGTSGRAINAAVQSSIGRLQAEAERNGWFGAPRPVDQVIASAEQSHDWQRTVLAASTAAAVFDALHATGQVPAGVRRPPGPPPTPDSEGSCTSLTWRTEFEAWMADTGGPTGDAVDRAVTAMLNGYGASDACEAIRD